MGVADVIPGVSGGTIALILNIYERLIAAIKSLSPKSVIGLLKCLNIWKPEQRVKLIAQLKELDLIFLIILASGIFSAVLSLSTIIPNLVFKYTEYTFGCFLGLIVPSIFIPWKMIKNKNAGAYVALILGLVLTILVSYFMKSHVSSGTYDNSFGTTAIILFISALIAISAMILPGISGSFILMLLGQYLLVSGLVAKIKVNITTNIYEILNKIGISLTQSPLSDRRKTALTLVENFSTLECYLLVGLFMLGCVIGILLMSRLIHYCLKKSHDVTMAFLTGMICSSLYVLWPFKEARPEGVDMKDWLPKASNILPDMNQVTVNSIIIFAVALIGSTAFIIYGSKRADKKETD